MTLWAMFGFAYVLATGFLLDRLIVWLAARP